ncbi:helix-turn-helix domain-containing protein [Salinibacterium soli]|uniref:Helix-turn-helix domain-containing protein n=1 Tax=Antiquaquibacter soli TaxID=3064523 RepID=A0ABT9BPX9_9MICO|nr:helix-turn-helix domain-containing protein [Protaetiibacter sp. WY-16]MDO7883040.1 helix-turn-helix domain-containing protein [Protaetiibacter sp. WY-16]
MPDLVEPAQHGDTFGFSAWRGRPWVMPAPHAHNDIEINVCPDELVYESGGRTTVFPAGVPCAFWGARPHQLIQAGDDFAFVTVPLAQFMSWGVHESIADGLLHGALLIGDDRMPLLDSFERWAHDLGSPSALGHRAAALEVEALLYRMAGGTWASTVPAGDRSSRDLDRASRMASFIAEHAGEDIRLADIAASIPLHQNRASALFRSVFGTSVTAYLGQFRVAEAQRLLLTTDLTSAAVAGRAGFQSLSAYHETFVRVAGVTPSQWRAANRRG